MVGSTAFRAKYGYMDEYNQEFNLDGPKSQLITLLQETCKKCPKELLKLYQQKNAINLDLVRESFNHWLYKPGSFMSKKIQMHFENITSTK